MKQSGKNKSFGFLQTKQNRAIVIILEVAALLSVVVLTCAVLSGNLLPAEEETTKYVLQNSDSTADVSNIYETNYAQGGVTVPDVTQSQLPGYTSTVNQGSGTGTAGSSSTGKADNTQTLQLESPAGWSKSRILSVAGDAVNKTKAYKNSLSVHHTEKFDAEVTQATGGSIVKSVANIMVGWVVKPVDETLNYQNGTAVNSEGETVPIILPKKNNFYLSQNGVTSATAKVVNNEYVINISLVEESVGMNEVPQYNASAIGYLDVANFDLSFLTVDSANITYKGSSLELHINARGYVTYAEYHIPLNIVGSGHSGSISGSVTFDGEQSEVWTLDY